MVQIPGTQAAALGLRPGTNAGTLAFSLERPPDPPGPDPGGCVIGGGTSAAGLACESITKVG